MSFKIFKQSLVFIQLVAVSMTFPVFALQEQQKEYAHVVNVELILRVLKDGSPVGGLKKEDFALFEDGEPCEINGFFEIHRRLAHAGAEKNQRQQPRLYLLFFWVNDPAADVEGVLKRFFSGVYREGDRVLLSTPLKTFELPAPQEIAGVTAAFLEQWRQEAKERLSSTLRLQGDLNRLLEDLARRLVEDMAAEKEEAEVMGTLDDSPSKRVVDSFVAQYARMVHEYQVRELSPDMGAFEAMARSLIPAKNDKFALVYFQHDSLPLFDIANVKSFCMTRRIPEGIASELTDAMAKTAEQAKNTFNIRLFPEALQSLFIQTNIQFHLLSLSPFASAGHVNADAFFSLTKNEEIYSNWDRIMQEISKNSGGLRLDGDHMLDALDQAGAFEDIYYQLTYVPRELGAKKRKIDIRVQQPGMQVIYGRTLEMKELPPLKIAALSATRQLMRLEIVDFYAISKDGVPTGFVNVQVTGMQTDSEPAQLLLSQTSETVGTIELPLAFPRPGSWNLEVRVIDQLTGLQDVKLARVEMGADLPALAAPDRNPDQALTALLVKAAAYAEKLKKAAFHFICRESVTENAISPGSGSNREFAIARTYWIYDYQIIARNGKIAESRVLLEKNGEKLRQANAELETIFQSYFSFYMPVTMLAREKQRLYQYRLLGREKINKTNVWRIAAVRRSPRQIPWGEIWVREEDGIVLKIQIDQTSIVGFEKLAQKAVDEGLLPEITTIHEYSFEKDGMCFPSKTTFIDRYNSFGAAANKQVVGSGAEKTGSELSSSDRSRTYFEYRDYQFFSVATQVAEKPE